MTSVIREKDTAEVLLRTRGELEIKSKLSHCSGFATLRKLNAIHEKRTYSIKYFFKKDAQSLRVVVFRVLLTLLIRRLFLSRPGFDCSKLTIETLKQCTKYVLKLTIKTPERRQPRQMG